MAPILSSYDTTTSCRISPALGRWSISARLADEGALQRREAVEGGTRQRPLVGRVSGIVELVEGRSPDERRCNRIIGDRETDRRLDQAVGEPFLDERLEPP